VTEQPTSGGVSTLSFAFVCQYLRDKAAIELSDDKNYLVNARLGELARELKLSSAEQVVVELQRRPADAELGRRVIEALTTKETFFFRDNHPFMALRDEVIPKLLKDNALSPTLRVWSAACSTGQEPYSLAMLVMEHFPTCFAQINILATDIDTSALARAREGAYKQHEMNRGLPAPFLAKYFHRKGALWEVGPAIKRLVRFQQLNLAGSWPSLGRFDLILVRNVLIYFGRETKQDILTRMAALLTSRGALLLGAGESTLGLDGTLPLERYSIGATSLYRRAATSGTATVVPVD
jgi:chemotaxis protein methyltransferase CheR